MRGYRISKDRCPTQGQIYCDGAIRFFVDILGVRRYFLAKLGSLVGSRVLDDHVKNYDPTLWDNNMAAKKL